MTEKSPSREVSPGDARRIPGVRMWPCLAIAAVAAAAALQLHMQGRPWWCACGDPRLWAGNVQSPHNSQHLLDPYSFTHLLHGFLFFWLLAWLCPRMSSAWKLVSALVLETGWEVLENTDFVIQRFREATVSLHYRGDTIANSMGDILLCGIGFALAWRLGSRWSLVVLLLTELALLLWIRDGLVLNILMLIYPSEAIKAWQMGQ